MTTPRTLTASAAVIAARATVAPATLTARSRGQSAAARSIASESAGMPTCAGLLFPSGVLRRVPGGFRAVGRWGFGSGIRHADWIITSAVLEQPSEATASTSPTAPPEMYSIAVPAREVVIEDTWHTAGLRGTGSHHYRLEDVFVPEQRSFPFPCAPALRGGAMFDLPVVAFLAPVHMGFVLGAARAALDAIARVAPQRIKAWPHLVLGSHAAFQMDLGRADAKLRAARAFASETCASLEQRTSEGPPLSLADWRNVRLSVTLATDVATEVASFAFHSGGGSALYEASPIERLFRDIHAATQHVAATDDAYEFAGRLMLGLAGPHMLNAPRAARA